MQILRRLISHLAPYKKALAIILFLLFAGTLMELVPPLVQRRIIDEVIENRDLTILGTLLVVLVLVYAIQQLLNIWDNFIRHKLGGKFILDLRVMLYAYLQKLSLSFFEKTSTGELMSRVTNDVNALEHFITHGATFVLIDLLRLLGTIGVLLWLKWELALLVCIPLPILAVGLRIFNQKIQPVYRNIRARLGDINARLQDNLSGIQTIQVFGQENHELERFTRESENYYNAMVSGIRYWSTFFPSMTFLTLLGNVIVLGVGSVYVVRDQMTIGSLTAFILYLNFLYAPVRRLIEIDNIIQEAMAAAERIFELFDETPVIKNKENAVPLAASSGRIEFKNVHFRYDTGEKVLHDVNFVMEPGEVVALVGPSGAGKSSLAALLSRFYDPTEGSILLDGKDLRDIEIHTLRKQFAVVLQDTFLFNASLKDNLLYGKPDASEEEVIAAAKAAYADGFINAMPDGYNTEIGERGVRLSGGQKQRIALARAMLADPRILILDEATSSVDAEAEYLIQQALESVLKGRTSLVIAHRLSTVQNADKIIALEDGRIVQIGSHEELLQRDGLYSQLYQRQAGLSKIA